MFIPSIIIKINKDICIVDDDPDIIIKGVKGKNINIAFGWRKDGRIVKPTEFLFIRVISEVIKRN